MRTYGGRRRDDLMTKRITAGFVGFACISFPKEITEKRSKEAAEAVKSSGIKLVETAQVSTFTDAERAIVELKKGDFDFLIICISSWIESPIVVKVLREFKHKPILLWGLGGYTKDGSLVSPASQAGTPALREPLAQMGFKFKFIYDWPDSPMNIDKVKDFAIVANAIKELSNAKIGMVGYADMGLYITMFDGVSLRSKIGPEVEVFDMLEVEQRVQKIDTKRAFSVIENIKKKWHSKEEIPEGTWQRLSKFYLAIDDIVTERKYSAISIKCVEGMKKYMNFPPCMILTLLSQKIPAICEDDALGSVTQLILKYISGQATAFMEMYEFMKDRILIAVCGFIPPEYIEGAWKVSPYGWGGLNTGVMNTSQAKTGFVTLARLGYRGDSYFLHVVTGEGQKPRKWEELGWNPPAPQFPGLEVILDRPVEQFADEVLSQHYILIYGDYRQQLKDFCNIIGINYI